MERHRLYVARNGETYGPYSLDQAKEYFATGQLLETDSALLEGKAEWEKLPSLLEKLSSELKREKAAEQPTVLGLDSPKESKPKPIKPVREEGLKRISSSTKRNGKRNLLLMGVVSALLVVGYFSLSLFWEEDNEISESHSMYQDSSNAVHLDPDILNSFLSSHCTDCHGPEKQNGETRLDTLTLNIADSDTALHWQEVLDVLNLGEMPPVDEKQPGKEELQSIIKHLTIALDASRKRLSEDGGNIAMRRINRREYRNTIEQLTGMRIAKNHENIIPHDSITENYDTIGQDQQFSSHYFDDYFEVGQSIALHSLHWVNIKKSGPKTFISQVEVDKNRQAIKMVNRYAAKVKNPRGVSRRDQNLYWWWKKYLNTPYNNKGVFLAERPMLSFPKFQPDPRASYKFSVQAGLTNIGKADPTRQFIRMFAGGERIGYSKVSGSLDSPQFTQTLEYQVPMQYRGGTGFNIKERKWTPKRSAIWVDATIVSGPFYKEPSDLETIFNQTIGPLQPFQAYDPSKGEEALDLQIKKFLQEFTYRAFRGKDAAPEFEKLVFKTYSLDRKRGEGVKVSLIKPLAIILSSPSFLYLMEDAPTSKESAVNEVEFANRISHFLWSRSASGELLADAKAGKLKDKAVLRDNIDRMLKHKNSFALSEGFFSQWVELKRLGVVGIDTSVHTNFVEGMRGSAHLEVQNFFDTMVKENLSLTQLIDSDFVIIDDLLALHYGMKISNKEGGFRKVKLPADSPRGGLLGTTAFLAMGSNGERASPIIRGALIQDKFLNRKPPPPPPNVAELENASDKPLAVKEAIELHRQKAQCASCHSSFDPLGFGLENFDLLGRWRDQEIIRSHETVGEATKDSNATFIPVRAEGVFPDQKPFRNLDEFKSGLLAHKNHLTRSIAEGLLSYGLGRHIEFADQQALDEICKQAAENDHQIGDLIYSIISLPLFKKADPFIDPSIAKN